MSLQDLLGHPNENGRTDLALVAISQNHFEDLTIADIKDGVEIIAATTMLEPLALLAQVCALGGQTMVAAAHIAIFTIHELFEEEEESAAADNRRQMEVGGYTSFTAFVDSLIGPDFPFSRSSVFAKVRDIEAWREHGTTWETVRDLLTKTPMAGRDAIRLLPTEPVVTIDEETGEVDEEEQGVQLALGAPMADYLESLTHMGPGEARRDVAEKAGLPERFIKEAVYLTGLRHLAIHAVWANKDVDIYVGGQKGIGQAEAAWLCSLLRIAMEVK